MFPNAVVLCNLNLRQPRQRRDLAMIRLAKLAMRYVQSAVAYAQVRSSTVLGYGRTGQKDHPPFQRRPFRTTTPQ